MAEEKQKFLAAFLRLRSLLSADLILSSLFRRKKRTAVSFATRSLSVAAVEEGQQICCCCLSISPDFILLTHFWLVSFSLSLFLSFFLYSKPSLEFSVSVVKVIDWFLKLRSLCLAIFLLCLLAGDFFLCPFVRRGFSKFFLCPSVCLASFCLRCGGKNPPSTPRIGLDIDSCE